MDKHHNHQLSVSKKIPMSAGRRSTGSLYIHTSFYIQCMYMYNYPRSNVKMKKKNGYSFHFVR